MPSTSLSAINAQIDLYPFLVLLDDAVVLAQRVAFPTVGQKNSLQVWMAVELNAKHVEGFAFQPVCRRPQRRRRGDVFAIRDLRAHAETLVARKRIKNPDDIELPLALRVVD